MHSSVQIGKLMGIPIRLHITFLAIILWVALVFSNTSVLLFGSDYGFGNVQPSSVRGAYSLAFAILLFVCVGLHELGHSYVAGKFGIVIRSITLYFFGGVSAMEDIPRDPRLELQMAIAGPIVSGILGIICIAAYYWTTSTVGSTGPTSVLLWTLGIINIILMIFNLIPAFPMDGGRVLRACFAERVPYIEATSHAASIGRMFAVIMGILGIFSLNLLLLVVAFFIYIGASEEERTTTMTVSLEGIKVRNIMSFDLHTVSPDISLTALTERMFADKHRGYPVVKDGSMVGMVTVEDIKKVPVDLRPITTAGDIMARKVYTIGPDEAASAAMKRMGDLGVRRLPVVGGGNLMGILSREDLVRAIELSHPS